MIHYMPPRLLRHLLLLNSPVDLARPTLYTDTVNRLPQIQIALLVYIPTVESRPEQGTLDQSNVPPASCRNLAACSTALGDEFIDSVLHGLFIEVTGE